MAERDTYPVPGTQTRAAKPAMPNTTGAASSEQPPPSSEDAIELAAHVAAMQEAEAELVKLNSRVELDALVKGGVTWLLFNVELHEHSRLLFATPPAVPATDPEHSARRVEQA